MSFIQVKGQYDLTHGSNQIGNAAGVSSWHPRWRIRTPYETFHSQHALREYRIQCSRPVCSRTFLASAVAPQPHTSPEVKSSPETPTNQNSVEVETHRRDVDYMWAPNDSSLKALTDIDIERNSAFLS